MCQFESVKVRLQVTGRAWCCTGIAAVSAHPKMMKKKRNY